jgi:hypothetical protein
MTILKLRRFESLEAILVKQRIKEGYIPAVKHKESGKVYMALPEDRTHHDVFIRVADIFKIPYNERDYDSEECKLIEGFVSLNTGDYFTRKALDKHLKQKGVEYHGGYHLGETFTLQRKGLCPDNF